MFGGHTLDQLSLKVYREFRAKKKTRKILRQIPAKIISSPAGAKERSNFPPQFSILCVGREGQAKKWRDANAARQKTGLWDKEMSPAHTGASLDKL